MQVPGYGHLHVDDESGGSGNPYDVRPQPKESERAEKSTKKMSSTFTASERARDQTSGGNAAAKRLRPLEGHIVVSEDL